MDIVKNIFYLLFLVIFSETGGNLYSQGNGINDPDEFLNKSKRFLYANTDSSLLFAQKAFKQYISTDAHSKNEALSLSFMAINFMLQGKNDTSLIYFNHALKNFSLLNEPENIVLCNLNIGELYYNWAMYDTALLYFSKSLNICEQKKLRELKGRTMVYLGKYYHSTSNYQKSEKNYKKALEIAQIVSDTLNIIIAQNKLGKHYETLGNKLKALEYYLKSEKMLSAINNKVEIASTYNQLGNIYHELKEFDRAIYFHTMALTKRQELNYKEGLAKSYNNLGEVLVDIELLDSAYHCFLKSYEICKEIGYVKGMIKSIHNQGVINEYKNKNPKALSDFKMALMLSEGTNYDKGVLNALGNITNIYIKERKLDSALVTSNQGLHLAEVKKVKSMVAGFNKFLYQIYKLKESHKLALTYFETYHEVHDELIDLETNKRIAELQATYELSLKERENEVLKGQNLVQELSINRKNTLIFAIFIILILLVSLILIIQNKYRHKQEANRQLSDLNEKISHQNIELNRLNKELNRINKQQIKLFSIISHELRNPLWWFRNLIQMLTTRIDSLDKEMIRKSLSSLNESATNTFHLLDNLLHWSRSQLGNIKHKPEPFDLNKVISENINMVTQFLEYKEIEIRYSPKEQAMVVADKNMVQTVVRNILSNAIKFTPHYGTIQITLKRNNNHIETSIRDNGIGMEPKTFEMVFKPKDAFKASGFKNEAGTGLGLLLSKEFIEKNAGTLTAQSTLNKGSVFTFTLPAVN